jgi:hypothetical protein
VLAKSDDLMFTTVIIRCPAGINGAPYLIMLE